jgi:hypothetical protein
MTAKTEATDKKSPVQDMLVRVMTVARLLSTGQSQAAQPKIQNQTKKHRNEIP